MGKGRVGVRVRVRVRVRVAPRGDELVERGLDLRLPRSHLVPPLDPLVVLVRVGVRARARARVNPNPNPNLTLGAPSYSRPWPGFSL